MPVLSNPKHELFAQALAKGSTIDKAYVTAGFKANRGNATVLKQKQSITTRLNELLAERDRMAIKATEKAAEALSIDRQWVMQALIDDRELARSLGMPAAAVSAANLLGKELGMFIDRSENTTTVRDITDEPVSEREWSQDHVTAH